MPSRLNEYPAGITSPTTGFAQPYRSILSSIRGSAASLDDVPSTIRISSRMNVRYSQSENPYARRIRLSTTKMKIAIVR